jgi:monomeric isocitrate dehydrogenase
MKYSVNTFFLLHLRVASAQNSFLLLETKRRSIRYRVCVCVCACVRVCVRLACARAVVSVSRDSPVSEVVCVDAERKRASDMQVKSREHVRDCV